MHIFSKNRGFTLIELLVVIAIIGILSSVVLASLNSARMKSRDARRIGDLKQLQLAAEMYYDSNNSYPPTLSALKTAGFIPAVPTDPSSTSTPYGYATSTSDFVLRAKLETNNNVLSSDVDGTVNTLDCTDSPVYYYCIQP